MIVQEDLYLEHFGVKGMRWGVRKNRANDVPKETTKKLSRRERKRAEAVQNFDRFLGQALKEPNSVVLLNGRSVVTGKEFTNYVLSGGSVNTSRTGFVMSEKNQGSSK